MQEQQAYDIFDMIETYKGSDPMLDEELEINGASTYGVVAQQAEIIDAIEELGLDLSAFTVRPYEGGQLSVVF